LITALEIPGTPVSAHIEAALEDIWKSRHRVMSVVHLASSAAGP
jgi:hypothetical protein